MDYFPYVDYKRNTQQLGSVVTPSDSLDIRMINAIAAQLNFTFVLREPLDRQWGAADAEGNWSGTVGTLQKQRADFSLTLSPTASRMEVVDYSRIFSPESFVIISLKPQPLPQSLSLVRPFTGWLWTAVVACGFSSGLVLWLLQTIWSWVSGERGVRLGSSLFYSWGALLENPPFLPPLTSSSRVVVGWWLVSCLVICTAYRSSLVAHLTFPKLFPPINSFQDLLDADDWRWGRQPASGTSFTFFNKSSDPIVNRVFQNIEYHWLEEQLKLVLAGRYSFLTDRYYIKAIVAARFTDSLGYTPFHTSTTHYPIYAGISWGFRKGSPLRSRITMMQQRLIEAGLIDYWMNHVINDNARRSRMERRLSGEEDQTLDNQRLKVEENQVVLGLHHLQGAFFFMLLGHSAGLLVWLGEKLHHRCRRQGRRTWVTAQLS
ncbi:glutamate receptor-like [Panulirus ornatus]|uniref:glutamate receptor-like n=1 Tax=Panulirus ornatus TaxID=150431 RepID=UPI003A8A28D4